MIFACPDCDISWNTEADGEFCWMCRNRPPLGNVLPCTSTPMVWRAEWPEDALRLRWAVDELDDMRNTSHP